MDHTIWNLTMADVRGNGRFLAKSKWDRLRIRRTGADEPLSAAKPQNESDRAHASGTVIAAVLCGHDGRRGYLHHLAVDAGHRRQGLGRALVERCLARLAVAGIPKCNIFLFNDNAEGRRFWESSGTNP